MVDREREREERQTEKERERRDSVCESEEKREREKERERKERREDGRKYNRTEKRGCAFLQTFLKGLIDYVAAPPTLPHRSPRSAFEWCDNDSEAESKQPRTTTVSFHTRPITSKLVFSLPALLGSKPQLTKHDVNKGAQQNDEEEDDVISSTKKKERKKKSKKHDKKKASKKKRGVAQGSGSSDSSSNNSGKNCGSCSGSHSNGNNSSGSHSNNSNGNNCIRGNSSGDSSSSKCETSGSGSCSGGSNSGNASKPEAIVNIYVKNLASEFTQREFEDWFRPFGGHDSFLSTDPQGNSRGFGFIKMPLSSLEKAQAKAEEESSVTGRKLWMGVAQAKEDRKKILEEAFANLQRQRYEKTRGQNLLIQNLPFECDSEMLRAAFSPLGVCTSCMVPTNEQGRFRGFGYCAFATKEDAQHAMTVMDGKEFMGRLLKVTIHVPKCLK